MFVDIALATYNGAEYLPDLMKSLQAQSHPNLRIVASDDGSTDQTLSILKHSAGPVPVAVVPSKPRLNILRNFENALAHTTAPYICLSDQDDVWHIDKVKQLVRAAEEFESKEGSDVPLIVFSDLEIVDDRLGTLADSFFASTRKSSNAKLFADFVLNNHIPGCSMLVNRPLLERALPFPDVKLHDHWLVQVAALFGDFVYVDSPLIKYRQHQHNAIGLGAFGNSLMSRAINFPSKLGRFAFRRHQEWREQATDIRANIIALEARFGSSIPEPRDRKLIRAILEGDKLVMSRLFDAAATGERKLDKIGIIRAIRGGSGSPYSLR
jgi:glycosyltransferase involved in cell wall biosynthesis